MVFAGLQVVFAGLRVVFAGLRVEGAGPLVVGGSLRGVLVGSGANLVVLSGSLSPWEPWAVEDADVNPPSALHKSKFKQQVTKRNSVVKSKGQGNLRARMSKLTTLAP